MPEISSRLITYCSNVHPGESWQETFDALQRHIPPVKAALTLDRHFPIGLRLSRRAADELTPTENTRFTAWLEENDCFVATLNGFAYGDFHGKRVKEQVYLPDWRSPERTAYSRRLANLLVGWLPEGLSGSISTVPIGLKGMIQAHDLDAVRRQLFDVLDHLHGLREERGREIVLALEPEPGCLLETMEEVCRFFDEMDLPDVYRGLLGVCYDCCHQAVEFEDPSVSLARLAEAGIRVAKVQVSSALALRAPGDAVLRRFDEPRYLHQVVIRTTEGKLLRFNDLALARAQRPVLEGDEWRCHFHLPIFLHSVESYGTTQRFLEDILPLLTEDTLLEVETYTWDVLPPELRCVSLTESIIRELEWLKEKTDAAHRRP